jgi:hypothetical protein
MTRCEDGLEDELKEACLKQVNGYLGEGFVNPNILQFKIMKD